MRFHLALVGLLATFASSLFAASTQANETVRVERLNRDGRNNILGAWIIADQSGGKICRVSYSDEKTIDGYVVEIDPACMSVFPLMDEVSAWRLDAGWTIVFSDATRNSLIRFTTPDETYVAEPETDGIFTMFRPE